VRPLDHECGYHRRSDRLHVDPLDPLGPSIQPSNDEPAGAKPLGFETVSGSTLGATKDEMVGSSSTRNGPSPRD
jgi:hypothetical protein